MGLRLKLGLYVVLFISTVIAAVGFFQLRAQKYSRLDQMKQRGVTLMRSFAIPCSVAIANNDMPALDNYVVQFAEAAEVMDLLYMAVLDFEGRVLSHTQPGEYGALLTDDFTKRAIATNEPVLAHNAATSTLEIGVPIIGGLRWGTVRAGFTLIPMEQQLAEERERLILTAAAVSFAAAAIAFLVLSLLVIRPVLRMQRMARTFGSGQLGVRVYLDQKDEIGDLAIQLNSMAEQIQNYTDSLAQLVEARTSELAEANDRLLATNAELERVARTDSLTGLYNRRYFTERLDFEVRRGARSGQEFCLLMMDVDHFKHYNDSHGHPAGDALLQRLAALLELNTRSTDVVARFGGEEFVALLLDTAPQEGQRAAIKLQRAVEAQPMPLEEAQPSGRLTVSIGVAFYPRDSRQAHELIEMADKALYRSKQAGRNRVTLYAEENAQAG